MSVGERYSMPDQPARFAKGKAEGNVRMLELEKIYDPTSVRGKVALVTGGNRGLGLAIVEELVAQGADVVVTTRSPTDIPGVSQVVSGIDVTDNKSGEKLVAALGSKKIDILV